MSLKADLDALIPRSDFRIARDTDDSLMSTTMKITDLEIGAFTFGALRKPDFQRETSDWEPKKIVELISSFLNGDLIPAIILWKNGDLLFVIDGSHRLSALIAWVQDDYGDGERSRKFFDYQLPEEQEKAAEQTRKIVEERLGAYRDHQNAIKDPDKYPPETVARARRLGGLALQLQWVRGDAEKAEESFLRINQQASLISQEEMLLIKSRRKPNAIAARSIIRRGTGHKYWSGFSERVQAEVQDLAQEVYELLFTPALQYPIKNIELPIGGRVYSSTGLTMVFDFVNLCAGAESSDDIDGSKTIEYLKRCRRVARLLSSKEPSSLGLHPAIYFYSWTGKQQPILLLVVTKLIMDLELHKKLPAFIAVRRPFEEFLLKNKPLINQVVRKYGTKGSGKKHLLDFYQYLLNAFSDTVDAGEVLARLASAPHYSFIQPGEIAYSSSSGAQFSSDVKSGVIIQECFKAALRCAICGGFVPSQAISIDHKKRRVEGGSSDAANAQVAHPYCNTGIKT
ncbi:HNH endonuclease family protein [Cystobacter fuscus]|uniref:HNH endonuclease family protein n=1 Tax=Cystobacter fuscus TaxID=43 RepID=UPI002B2DB6FE|nr:DUF262 domain-containing protein [Cystobacter fuscus]